MPLVRIVSNQLNRSSANTQALLGEVSQCAARLFGKPERWVMTCADPAAVMTYAGTTDPTCYVEVKNIGSMSATLTKQLSAELCAIISRHLQVEPNRTYIEFTNAQGQLWGYDGSTFG